jgi:hypothetical protein
MCKILVVKPEKKTQSQCIGTHGNILPILMLKKQYWSGLDWIRLAHEKDKWHPFAKTVIKRRISPGAVNFFNSYEITVFSVRASMV